MSRSNKPRVLVREPEVHPQPDGYTCGYCTMVTVYKAYGKSRRNLRKRLNVDRGKRLGLEEWVGGVLPKTMLNVLHEDGFLPELTTDVDMRRLRKHLREDLAIALVVNVYSEPHWLVFGTAERGVRVYDSCQEEPVSWSTAKARKHIAALIYLQPRAEYDYVFAPTEWAKEWARIAKIIRKL